ncbi:WRC [Macleaya cordata]|uniref:WRC n=1 Tax=Macleaya cordata TaxID=56857 RepID=A0A200PWF1_MACCD|nr:WRC [Macleaya cordata]
MESSVITPEDVLESLMNDGTIDAIRLKIINQLKANEELKNNTLTMVEQSKVLNTPGAEKQTKRELFDALRQELETPVLEKASKSVWELILDNDGLGKEISETVEKVFCRLSGRDPPLFPPNNETRAENENEKEKEEEREDLEKDKEKENLVSSSKKRNFSEMNVQGGGELDGSGGSPAIPEDSVPESRNVSVDHEMESEPWRCKRTDGKSWRCTKDAVPDQKYCEKHIYRGRSRSRKHAETTSLPATSSINMKESNTNISVSISPELMTNDATSNDGKDVSPPKNHS